MRARAPTSDLLDIARHFRTGMLVTTAPGGALTARPMAIAHIDDEGTIWFVTASDASILDDFKVAQEAAFTCMDARRWLYVFGRVAVVHDPGRARALWSDRVARWVPQGPEHETTVLLELRPVSADFWDLAHRGLLDRSLHSSGDDLREGHVSF